MKLKSILVLLALGLAGCASQVPSSRPPAAAVPWSRPPAAVWPLPAAMPPAPASNQTVKRPHPTTSNWVELDIRGFMTRGVSFSADGVHASCVTTPMLDKAPPTRTEVTPDEKAWADFWGTVSRLDLASWKPSYDPQDTAKEGESISIVDGTMWKVHMGKQQKLFSSEGDNAYPTIGQPTHTTLESASVDELFKAFNRLIDSAAAK